MLDAGADRVFDFVDVGAAILHLSSRSIPACPAENCCQMIEREAPDVVVAEAGASPP